MTIMNIEPVDDVSEGLLTVSRVDGRAAVAGNEVGGIVEQMYIDQV